MVITEYNIDKQLYKVDLSYMFPKKVLLTLPKNTPPVDVGTSRHFQGYLEQLNTDAVQLCVELKTKGLEDGATDEEEEEDEDEDEDENDRFDWCDDSDGASSGDEDFATYGLAPDGASSGDVDFATYGLAPDGVCSGDVDFATYGLAPEGKENKVNSPTTKTGSSLTNAHVKLELSELTLAIGDYSRRLGSFCFKGLCF
ncbi:unnamed protein product [Microthlaspi erraticum]|uniref:Uncharacterized protein n=1 Tax=Microthlaspi erraticum TaxID=1685480 RepID=A0A6D2HF21_9BRAS|nr:unnamed protein product [Microthlaspi erraticum]